MQPTHGRLTDRAFGLTIAGVLLVITGVVWLASRHLVTGTIVAAGVLAVVALVAPGILWPWNRLWTGVVAPRLASLNNHVVLGAMYFLLFTPVALFFRLVRRDALALRFEPSRESYLEPVGRQTTSETLRDVY